MQKAKRQRLGRKAMKMMEGKLESCLEEDEERIQNVGNKLREIYFYVNEKCSSPSVIAEKPGGERRQDEGTDSGSADGDASGQCPPLFKVESDGDDSRNVDKTHADATQYADKDVKELDGHDQRRDGEAEARPATTLPTHATVRKPN